MQMKFLVTPVIGLIVSGVLLTGCSEKTPSVGMTTDKNANVPADPSIHRSDLETLTQRPKETAPKKTLSSAIVNSPPTAREFGVPIYPAATLYKDETGIVSAVIHEGIKSVILETKDSQAKVMAFYRQEMPAATVTKEPVDGKPSVLLSEPTGKNGLRAVEITEKDGKTRIHLTNVAEMTGVSATPPALPQAGNPPPN